MIPDSFCIISCIIGIAKIFSGIEGHLSFILKNWATSITIKFSNILPCYKEVGAYRIILFISYLTSRRTTHSVFFNFLISTISSSHVCVFSRFRNSLGKKKTAGYRGSRCITNFVSTLDMYRNLIRLSLLSVWLVLCFCYRVE